MALHENPQQHIGLRLPTRRRSNAAVPVTSESVTTTSAAAYAFAATRVLLGFVFLWAFFDKAFGWGYATPAAKSWVNGGSPTKGFLSGVSAGPMESTFHSWAGNGLVDWLFMLGLLGIGAAMIAGVAVRIAAASGILMVAFMWLATYPLAQHTSTGAPTSSTNPFVDEHVMDAFALLAVAAFGTASSLGLGAMWARLPLVKRHRALL